MVLSLVPDLDTWGWVRNSGPLRRTFTDAGSEPTVIEVLSSLLICNAC